MNHWACARAPKIIHSSNLKYSISAINSFCSPPACRPLLPAAAFNSGIQQWIIQNYNLKFTHSVMAKTFSRYDEDDQMLIGQTKQTKLQTNKQTDQLINWILWVIVLLPTLIWLWGPPNVKEFLSSGLALILFVGFCKSVRRLQKKRSCYKKPIYSNYYYSLPTFFFLLWELFMNHSWTNSIYLHERYAHTLFQ